MSIAELMGGPVGLVFAGVLGAIVGIEPSQDASILSDAFYLLSLGLDELLLEASTPEDEQILQLLQDVDSREQQ